MTAKINRAIEHANTLNGEIKAWFDGHPYSFLQYANSERTRYGLALDIKTNPDMARWAVLAGDSIHNLRSALDHLAYAISVHELKSNPPPNEGRIAFVVCDDPNSFKSKYWRIENLSEPVRNAIAGVQPYTRKNKVLPPLLGLLRDLDDSDKHKLLTPMLAHASDGIFGNFKNVPDDRKMTFLFVTDPLEHHKEVAAIEFEEPTPDVQYEFYLTVFVAVRHAPGPTGYTITNIGDLLLHHLLLEVREVIGIIRAAVS